MKQDLTEIAKQFLPEENIDSIEALNGGLINLTYIVRTKGNRPDLVIQKKNSDIFKNIPEMVNNIVKVTDYIKSKIEEAGEDPANKVLRLVKSGSGDYFFKDTDGDYWVASEFIPDTVTYEKASDENLAQKGGEGLGQFLRQLADFKDTLYPTIEGFHDMSFRFKQWDESLANDKAGRKTELEKEINWIESRRPKIEEFWRLVESGKLPKRVTHNDTKLSNFLFDKNGNVECVIDLDTVMSNTALADYGDAIRSFANSAKEDEPDLDKVELDMKMFEAYTKGYLNEAARILTESEKENLPFGPIYITYEQTLRFLMDYIDGDTYYKTEYPSHNLVRTHSQMKLLESMENNFEEMKRISKKLIET